MVEEFLIPIILFIILLPIIMDIINEYYNKKENNNYPEIIIGSSWKMRYNSNNKIVKIKDLRKTDSNDVYVNILVDNKIVKLKLSTFLSEYKPYE